MGKDSKIQWTDASINFWSGCAKISDGCKFCYMYRDKERYGLDPSEVVKVSDTTIKSTLRKLKEPSKIFTCSWSDFFIKEADQWRSQAWDVIRAHPQHTWQILTKRPERIEQCLPPDWGDGWNNVILGVSVENQKTANDRIWRLKMIPSKQIFISVEPLLEKINIGLDLCLTGNLMEPPINWVIIGGESGNDNGKYRYRPCELSWIENIIGQCKYVGTPVFVKQLGTYLSKEMKLNDRHAGDIMEFPKHLQIREFPKSDKKV